MTHLSVLLLLSACGEPASHDHPDAEAHTPDAELDAPDAAHSAQPSQPLEECALVDCDPASVTCDTPQPDCEGQYSVPSVEDGYWARCVHPAQCRE